MWSKVGIGGEHYRYYKHNKFRQNPRGDPKFLVDLTRNDPQLTCTRSLCPLLADTSRNLVTIINVTYTNLMKTIIENDEMQGTGEKYYDMFGVVKLNCCLQ